MPTPYHPCLADSYWTLEAILSAKKPSLTCQDYGQCSLSGFFWQDKELLHCLGLRSLTWTFGPQIRPVLGKAEESPYLLSACAHIQFTCGTVSCFRAGVESPNSPVLLCI